MEPTALYLTAPLALDAPDGAALPSRLSGIAYSGGLASQWGAALAIDLDSLTIEPRLPLLYEHQRETVVGTVEALEVRDGQLALRAALFSDIDETAAAIARKAQRGLAWQLSIGVFDAQAEERARGDLALNGRTLAAPLTVLRQGVLREVSIVALGADRHTTTDFFTAGRPSRPPLEDRPMPDPTDQERIRALEAQIADLSTQLHAAEAARAAAEQSLADTHLSARRAQVQALFSELGRECTDAAAAPYLALTAEAFAAIAADLRAAKPKAPAHLFGEQATGDPAAGAPVTLNTQAIYAQRQARG